MKNPKELAEQAYQLGFQYEGAYGGCAQCVLSALADCGLPIAPAVIQSATGLAAGVARSGNSCGALTGGIMALSCVLGRDRDHMEDTELSAASIALSRKLLDRFMKAYGSGVCRDIQYCLMGASYRMYQDEDRERFLQAGGHDDICTGVVGRCAQWVVEILAEEGLL